VQVKSSDSQESKDSIENVLSGILRKGVRLWSENGQLRYRAPKGTLTQEEIGKLKASRSQLVALLERSSDVEIAGPTQEPDRGIRYAPLAFSQLAHWNAYRLSERCAIRQIASATRLLGRLKVDLLRRSVAEIVHRHGALRTRIVVCDGVPAQEISESGDCELEVRDLTTVSEPFREAEVNRLIEELILEPIDVTVGPLFQARLLALGEDEYVLILVMEHIISDGFSRNLLLRDLFLAYTQGLNGRAFSLPEMPAQFADYAVSQRSGAKSWVEKHGTYWNEHLTGCQRLRFPDDQCLQTSSAFGWGAVHLHIGRSLKAELREWCRLRRTTLAMSVFTAYVGLTLSWCNASESVIQYQSDGRVSPDLQNIIGYFASILYLRIELHENDTFVDLMTRVTEEYCNAYKHADFSYMLAQIPRPEFTRNTGFNWQPQESLNSNPFDPNGLEGKITCLPIRFAHPMVRSLELDGEPSVSLFDADDEIVGDVYFPRNRFSISTMEKFGRNFMLFIEKLLREPEKRVKEIVFWR
jgi:hypothetical protein